MASKRRLRRRSCERKRRYASEASARSALLRTNRLSEFPRLMVPYRCRFCNGWHFGRQAQKRFSR